MKEILKENNDYCIPSLRNKDTLKVKRDWNEVNTVLSCLKVKNLDYVKELVGAGARIVCKRLVVMSKRNEKVQPFWNRQIKVLLANPERLE